MPKHLRNPFVLASALALLALAGCETQSKPGAKEPASSAAAAKGTTTGASCNPKVGQKAPALAITPLNGGGKAAITPGKVTIVDFWATWCGPCRESFPSYQALYTKYKAQGLEVIALSMDEEANDIPGFVKEHSAKFPVGWDKGHAFAECWKPATMPSAYVVDRKGIVRVIHNKWTKGDEKELEAQIKALL